jgi:hypothetical protein
VKIDKKSVQKRLKKAPKKTKIFYLDLVWEGLKEPFFDGSWYQRSQLGLQRQGVAAKHRG